MYTLSLKFAQITYNFDTSKKTLKSYITLVGFSALSGKMLLVRIVENKKNPYFRAG